MFKSLMVASVLLGSLAGFAGTMPRVEAQEYYIRQDLTGKQVTIVFVDGKSFGGQCVYQDGDSIGISNGSATYYIPYAQIREISFQR